MYTLPKISILMSLCVSLCISPCLANDKHFEDEDKDFKFFTALSLVGGIFESSNLDGSGRPFTEFDDFLSLNWELHIEWKGFFYEQPGVSQQRIDGQFSGNAAGYRFFSSSHWDFEALVIEGTGRHVSEFSSPTESLRVERKADRRVGFRANGFYDDYFLQFIWTPHSLRDEIGGNQLSASIRRDWQIKNLNLYATAGLLYRSEDIMSFYFDVTPELSSMLLDLRNTDPEASFPESLLAPFDAKDGIIYSSQVGLEYPLSEHWVIGGVLSYQSLPSSVSESVLGSAADDLTVAAFSITYVF